MPISIDFRRSSVALVCSTSDRYTSRSYPLKAAIPRSGFSSFARPMMMDDGSPNSTCIRGFRCDRNAISGWQSGARYRGEKLLRKIR